jgi:hypothetical protein
VDGFVSARWRLEKGQATLRIEPFRRLSGQVRAEVSEEGARLLGFLAPEADRSEIEIAFG